MSICGHIYTTVGGRAFSCVSDAHPQHPDNHHFQRDLVAEARANAAKRKPPKPSLVARPRGWAEE